MIKKNKSIFVTKSSLPKISDYIALIRGLWQSHALTNNGQYVQELEEKLIQFLKIKNLTLIANGDSGINLAINALKLKDEIITTPFSYVSTTSSILWQKLTPVFADVDPNTFCIDPKEIEKKITPKTSAILATHVFGNPCEVQQINKIAKKHKLKVIYDAAHAFNVLYKNKSILNYGDISILSFHATKLFQTIEGGAVVSSNKKLQDVIKLKRQFGHRGDSYFYPGINAKMSEFHAAMGLCNLKTISNDIEKRKNISGNYDDNLAYLFKNSYIRKQVISKDVSYNFSYYPLYFYSDKKLEKIIKALNANNIYPRRYFYPSLNTLKYLPKKSKTKCSNSEDVASKILCLPLDIYLSRDTINFISNTIIKEYKNLKI